MSKTAQFGESLAMLDSMIGSLEAELGPKAAAAASKAAAPETQAEVPVQDAKPKTGKRGKKGKGGETKGAAWKPGDGKKKKAPAAPADQHTFSKIDLRVGQIVKVWPHPDADGLWCEEIDVGEETPRQIASGLRKYYTQDEMMGMRLIAVCNLKPRALVGFKSHGMVLCAKDEATDTCKFVDPPAGAKVGDRVGLEGLSEPLDPPFPPAKVQKKKAWEALAAGLATDANGVACFEEKPMMAGGEKLTCSVKSQNIS